MKKILILESNEKNFEAIGKCFEDFKEIEVIIVTSLEEAKILAENADKIIISTEEEKKEAISFMKEISSKKPIIMVKHEGIHLKFIRFTPEMSSYFMHKMFEKKASFTWTIILKELNNIH